MPLDPAAFKSALTRWASGVTVITARPGQGEPVGITATSFSSLSLDPPLVLFCLGLDSTNREAFEEIEGFAAHILAEHQDALSNRFASRGADKFAGLSWDAGRWGAPLLADCAAVLQCRVHSRLPGGDHLIFVGEVQEATVSDRAPLVYYRGAYGSVNPRG